MTDDKQAEAIRQARNQYYKAYRAKNKDKIREINNRYWARKAAQAEEVEEDAETTGEQ